MKIVKPIVFRNFDFARLSDATYYDAAGILQTAAPDVLREGYNPTTLDFIGPILENEATNYLESNVENSTYWTWGGSPGTVSTEAGTNPDGTSPVVYIENGIRRNSIPPAEGVFSVYAKLAPGSSSNLLIPTVFGTNVAHFNLATGNVDFANASAINPSMQQLPNGWYRCSFAVSGGASFFLQLLVSGKAYIFGPQFEDATSNNLPTSYIYTTNGPQTRAADTSAEGPPQVITSNVEEDDAPVWEHTDTFTARQLVVVLGSYHKVYESIGSTPADKFPPEHPEYWIDRGATNRWRMFDMSVGPDQQTVSTDSSNTVNVVLDFDQIVTSVTLLNMEANNVRIIMRDEFGNTVYDHYEDLLQSTPSSDWWSFFFATRSNIKTLVLTDLPSVKPSTIEMILEGDAFPAKIGKMIVGEAVEIGCARYGTSVGIVDFSRKERDPFGNNFIVERRYIDRADFDVQIPTSTIDSVKSLLASIRATPALYIGDEQFASTVLYGFYRDFSIVISGPRRSDATIQVESI